VLILQCAQAGLLYVNGGFCGELREPQALPIRPDGRVYLEFHGLEGPAIPLAVALDFAEGRLRAAPSETAYAVEWPELVTEVELRPVPWPKAPASREVLATLAWGENELTHQRVGDMEVLCAPNDAPLFATPAGLHGLRMQAVSGGALLFGAHEGGESAWLIADAPDGSGMPELAGEAHGQRLVAEADGALRALVPAGDATGHARSLLYRVRDGRLALQREEGVWMPGAPRWPRTPRETLGAYVNAVRFGDAGEAAGYLTKDAAAALTASPLPAFHAAVELPRHLASPPEGCPLALGLLEAAAGNWGRVRAVCARATAASHPQGEYLLERVEVVE
jgi:hypothetical protein